ncbi:MAG: lactococcin 972 family bacteriocin [Enterococcus casseliflavus]
MKKKLVVSLLLGIIMVSTSLTADALNTSKPYGGYWKYGVAGVGSISSYTHWSKTHSATVAKGSSSNFNKRSAGTEAYARLWTYSGCGFYYNIY